VIFPVFKSEDPVVSVVTEVRFPRFRKLLDGLFACGNWDGLAAPAIQVYFHFGLMLRT
jgi:hypothetical protein